MSTTVTKSCNGCRRSPINTDYTLQIHMRECLPDIGGWSTGNSFNEVFDFCGNCKSLAMKELLEILRKKRI